MSAYNGIAWEENAASKHKLSIVTGRLGHLQPPAVLSFSSQGIEKAVIPCCNRTLSRLVPDYPSYEPGTYKHTIMFAAPHLYLITLFLFSRFNLTIAVTKYLKQRTYSHNPAVQALHHCFSAISLIPFDGSFCLDRIRPGDVYSAMFRLRSCVIIVFSVFEKPTATTPFLSPMQNVVILHKDMWPRLKYWPDIT